MSGGRARWLVGGLVVVASLVAGDRIAGARLRLDGVPAPPFGELPASRRAAIERQLALAEEPGSPLVERDFDPDLGWCVRPGPHKGQHESGWINALGARGPEVPDPDPRPVRVVCFGESFTFGSEVEDDVTWPARLEALDPRVRALNFGVGGYGTDQALLRFRRDGRDLGGDVLVIGLLTENIGRNVNRYRPRYAPRSPRVLAKPRFVLEEDALRLVAVPYPDRRTMLEAALDGTILDDLAEHEAWRDDPAGFAWSAYDRSRAQRRAVTRRQHEALWSDPDGEPYRVTMALLETFREEARAAGIEHVVLVVFPTRRDVRNFWNGIPAWYEDLLGELASRAFAVIDGATVVQGLPRGTRAFEGHHPSPAANTAYAEALHAWLQEHVPALESDAGPR